MVLLNLYGDIVSDVVAQPPGSVGIAGSANIADDFDRVRRSTDSGPRCGRSGARHRDPAAMINYYFRSKQALYEAVVTSA